MFRGRHVKKVLVRAADSQHTQHTRFESLVTTAQQCNAGRPLLREAAPALFRRSRAASAYDPRSWRRRYRRNRSASEQSSRHSANRALPNRSKSLHGRDRGPGSLLLRKILQQNQEFAGWYRAGQYMDADNFPRALVPEAVVQSARLGGHFEHLAIIDSHRSNT